MPSEWATEKAAHLTAVLDAQSVQHQSARILAEALDAARIEGLEEAARIAENAFNTTGNRHEDTCCCIRCLNAVLVEADIRKRIKEMKG